MDDGPWYEGRRRRLLLVTLVLGAAATSFPTTLLAASLDTIRKDFGTSTTIVAWVQVAPSLAFGLGMPLLGKLGDWTQALRDGIIGVFGILGEVKGLIDDVPVDQVVVFARELREYLKSNKPDFITKVMTEKQLGEEAEAMLKEAIKEVTSSMLAAA